MTAPTRLAPSSKNFALAADSLNEGKYRLGVSPSLYHLKSRWPPIPNGCSGPSSAPAMNPSTDVDRAVTTIVMLASSPGTVPGHPAPPAVRRASWSWRLGSARGGAMVSIDLLGIYLNDHLGGSIAGVEVAEKLRSKNEGTPFGTTLSGLVLEVKEDRATLENLMDRLGIERNPAEQADGHRGAFVGDRREVRDVAIVEGDRGPGRATRRDRLRQPGRACRAPAGDLGAIPAPGLGVRVLARRLTPRLRCRSSLRWCRHGADITGEAHAAAGVRRRQRPGVAVRPGRRAHDRPAGIAGVGGRGGRLPAHRAIFEPGCP